MKKAPHRGNDAGPSANPSACKLVSSPLAGGFFMARRPKPWFRKDRDAWFVTINGTRHNLGADKKTAFDTFYRLMRQPQTTAKVPPQTMLAVADAFLDWVQRHRSPDTFEWYRYRLQRFCDRYPELRTCDLRPFHVQVWVDSSPDLSRTTCRNYIRSVKRCLKWAQQQGYIEVNPIALMEVPSAERRETIITAAEFEALLEHAVDETFRDLLVVTWETGCRPQELLRVEARHVDLARQRWVFPLQESKGKRTPRIVYLTERPLEITRRLMDRYPKGRLFRNSRGKPWTTSAVNCAVDRVRVRMGKAEMQRRGESVRVEAIAEMIPQLQTHHTMKGRRVEKTPAELRCEAKAKLTARMAADLAPRYSLYALRHSWATRALQSGLDGLTVAILMGHADPSTLAKVYQHLSHNPEHLLEQAKRAAG
jgi:integrase/recombinase XerD